MSILLQFEKYIYFLKHTNAIEFFLIMRKYSDQLYANKYENLEKMVNFLKNSKLS